MYRYCFYVDGFNMYFALNGTSVKQGYSRYKWLNYHKMAASVLKPNHMLETVYYFSAYLKWKPDNYRRHRDYVTALRWAGVEFVKGRFKKRNSFCPLCHRSFSRPEEKQTDVNIAIKLFSDAVEDNFDRAVIVSADSDLTPVILAVRKLFPDKKVGVMFPIGRNSFELKQESDFRINMSQELLRASQLPDEITVGKTIIKRPNSWK